MMLIDIIDKGLCFLVAALGFALFFNTPSKALLTTSILAILGGTVRVALQQLGCDDILSTLGGSSTIGILAIQAAHYAHVPQVVLSIPALIPLVPGSSTYRMMKGLLSLTHEMPAEDYMLALSETVQSGLSAAFITMAIAIGVAIPLLISRENSGKHLYFKNLFRT